jgi:transcriptional regulator with XRE-family HTH domain
MRREAARPRISQRMIAEELGLRQQAVSAWETGVAEPSLDTIAKLEDLLNLERGQLLRDAGMVITDALDISDLPAEDQTVVRRVVENARFRRHTETERHKQK